MQLVGWMCSDSRAWIAATSRTPAVIAAALERVPEAMELAIGGSMPAEVTRRYLNGDKQSDS